MALGTHLSIGLLLTLGVVACGSSGTDGEPAPTDTVATNLPGPPEQPILEGDFSLVDLDETPVIGVEGVVPTLTDLPLATTQRTLRYIEYFAKDEKGRKAFQDRYRAGGRYRDVIERKLRDADLPEDLVWLAAIESAMNPEAASPEGAVGLFQFMPDTAARFGLLVTSEIDERRSITKSTDAAIVYLGFLFDRYGSWDVALAAYNWGEGNIDKALETARQKLGRGKEEPVAFHELAELRLLPRETANFVPQIHAFAIVAQNRRLLEIEPTDIPLSMALAEIAIPSGTRLLPIAKSADLSLAQLREYNPDILTDRLPDGHGDFLIEIPADRLEQTLAALPTNLVRDDEAKSRGTKKSADGKDDNGEPAKSGSGDSKTAGGGGTGDGAGSGSGNAPGNGAGKTIANGAQTRKPLPAAPFHPGAFVLSSGVLVTFDKTDSNELTLSGEVTVLDPMRGRRKVGDAIAIGKLDTAADKFEDALQKTKASLRGVVFGAASKSLVELVTPRRKRIYEKTGYESAFTSLSERAFPAGDPMHGALLVGPTEPADDMFLEPQPSWAFETVLHVSGQFDSSALEAPIDRAFSDFYEAPSTTALPKAARTHGKGEKSIVVAWVQTPSPNRETATDLAFLIECHDQLGRFHRALRREKAISPSVHCSLEKTPTRDVAWVLATPQAPYSIDDTEKAIERVVSDLTANGPTEAELASAKNLYRTELAKKAQTATMRAIPRGGKAHNERRKADLGDLGRDDVEAAAKRLFADNQRLVFVGD